MNKSYVLAAFALVLLMTFLTFHHAAAQSPGVACPMTARMCPDGSFVSPIGPNCEMAACPTAGDAPVPKNSNINCPEDFKTCPDGKHRVGRRPPKCDFAPCPESKSVDEDAPEPDDIASCKKDADCVVVPFDSCCGATKRAISKSHFDDYRDHFSWHRYYGPDCPRMSACKDDGYVTSAHCDIKRGEKTGACVLNY